MFFLALLIKTLEEFAVKRGYTRIVLSTLELMPQARLLYESIGFTLYKTTEIDVTSKEFSLYDCFFNVVYYEKKI
jgi:hypothetical protein